VYKSNEYLYWEYNVIIFILAYNIKVVNEGRWYGRIWSTHENMRNACRVFGQKISREILLWRLGELETKSYAWVNESKNINCIRQQLQNTDMWWSDYQQDFGLEIGFTDHFNIRLVTTLNYSSIVNLHTLQITIAHIKCFQSAVSLQIILW
jgi:hypothetical protein